MGYFDESTTVEDVIENCTQMIEQSSIQSGIGNRISSPILSVFLGKDAVKQIPQVQSTYFSGWSAEARKLKFLKGCYTREEISAQMAEATCVNTNYSDFEKIRVVWYWDIMDDDFEQQFECIKQEIYGPIGKRVHRNYFIFCSQRDFISQNKTETRLKRLIQWNQENQPVPDVFEPMVIFSDATRRGTLDSKGIKNNYHMAATTVLMLNTDSNQPGYSIGLTLDFEMRKRPFWAESYHACDKNFFDIIGVSLKTIIESYQNLSTTTTGNQAVQSRICGPGGDYITFLDDVFEKVVAPKCINEQQAAFWADLPYTLDMAALERKVSGAPEKKMGIFDKLFRKNNNGNPDYAIHSVKGFWDACVAMYYTEPVKKWIASPEGERAIKEYIYGKMTVQLTLNDMKFQLPNEWVKLEREEMYQNIVLKDSAIESKSLAMYLHHCAFGEVKVQIYKTLLKMLGDIMKELHQHTDGFETMLQNVKNTLQTIQMDGNIERTYGQHMKHLIDANHTVLNQKIHPCATEPELLGQLEQAFADLVKQDPERMYYCTLLHHIKRLIKNNTQSEGTVISTFFNFPMESAGRLVTLQADRGSLFCVMNDQLNDLINGQENRNIGQKFIVNRCDRIERLYLYPVEPATILYH